MEQTEENSSPYVVHIFHCMMKHCVNVSNTVSKENKNGNKKLKKKQYRSNLSGGNNRAQGKDTVNTIQLQILTFEFPVTSVLRSHTCLSYPVSK